MRRTVLLSCLLLVCSQLTYVRSADGADIEYFTFADAALLYKGSRFLALMSSEPPMRPFKYHILCAVVLNESRTSRLRTFLPLSGLASVLKL